MISKGHHYEINLGVAYNFYISIDPVFPFPVSEDLSERVISEESKFSLLRGSSSPLSTMSFDRP